MFPVLGVGGSAMGQVPARALGRSHGHGPFQAGRYHAQHDTVCCKAWYNHGTGRICGARLFVAQLLRNYLRFCDD